MDPSGTNVYVTGRAYDGFSDDYATLAIDATTGDQLWAALYDGPAHAFDWPYAIAIRPDGTMVYVTGNSVARNSDDFLTVAYSA